MPQCLNEMIVWFPRCGLRMAPVWNSRCTKAVAISHWIMPPTTSLDNVLSALAQPRQTRYNGVPHDLVWRHVGRVRCLGSITELTQYRGIPYCCWETYCGPFPFAHKKARHVRSLSMFGLLGGLHEEADQKGYHNSQGKREA